MESTVTQTRGFWSSCLRFYSIVTLSPSRSIVEGRQKNTGNPCAFTTKKGFNKDHSKICTPGRKTCTDISNLTGVLHSVPVPSSFNLRAVTKVLFRIRLVNSRRCRRRYYVFCVEYFIFGKTSSEMSS